MSAFAEPYSPAVRRELPRLLSWLDRESPSLTYGCFDRTYWSWKFTDFPAARFQEGVYGLAHLLQSPRVAPELADDPRVLDWIRAGLRFWSRLQHRDGSFDEAYPYERSLAATAFTAFYLGEAFLRVSALLPADEQAALRAVFARAGEWLCRNDERHGVLSNHLAAAAAALDAVYRIGGEERFAARSRHFLRRILDRQSPEGWYEEYGGADPGYQTHATFYLARVWQRTRDAELHASLARSLAFLKHFVHPNGTLGGEYGSRNTEFYFPAGLEMLAGELPDAASIAGFLRPAVARGSGAGLAAMDAFNFLPMLNNYLFAGEHAAELPEARAPLPCETEDGEWSFPAAGLVARSRPSYFAVVGASKGGVVKLYSRRPERLALGDCGYAAWLADGRVASSQALDLATPVTRDGDAVTLAAPFVELNRRTMSPWLFLAFRAFSLTLGRARPLAYWLKRRLVQALVRRRRAVPLRLERRVELGPREVRIVDTITSDRPLALAALRPVDKFASIHMGSSRYFQAQDLDGDPVPAIDLAPELRRSGRVRRERTWRAEAGEGGERR